MSSKRKDDHIKLALLQKTKSNRFDQMILNATDLPGFGINDVKLNTQFLDNEVPYPVYINAMTGGSLLGSKINEFLAKLANHFNLPMVTGSQSIALKDESKVDSFTNIRNFHKGILLANINPNYDLIHAKKAVDMIDANALSIHLNLLQELVMIEGDRDFSHWDKNIESIIKNLDKPVLIKQVGSGLSAKTIEKLKLLGAKNIDVSGSGGTSFLSIESNRGLNNYDYLKSFEIETLDILLSLKDEKSFNVYASGGIRNPLDVIKCLVLGAKSVGLSKYFLNLYELGIEKAITEVENFLNDLKKIMLLLGAKTIDELKNCQYQIL